MEKDMVLIASAEQNTQELIFVNQTNKQIKFKK